MINFTLKFIVLDELSFKSLQSKIYYFMQIVLYVQIFNVPFYPKFLSVEDSRLAVEISSFFDNFYLSTRRSI